MTTFGFSSHSFSTAPTGPSAKVLHAGHQVADISNHDTK